MDALTLSLVSLSGMLVLIALRVPIGIAMGAVAFLGFWYLRNFNVALSALSDTPFVFAASSQAICADSIGLRGKATAMPVE